MNTVYRIFLASSYEFKADSGAFEIDCDMFVLLFWTKVGVYTKEEFDVALN